MVAPRSTPRFLLVLLSLTLAPTVQSALAEEEVKSGTNPECFLHKATDGSVWVGVPLVSLGMIGVGGEPQVRLSKQLAEQYAPLVNTLAEPQDRRYWWWKQLPRARRSRDPTILISMHYQTRVLPDEHAKRADPGEPQHVEEIVSAEITAVEIVPRAWLSAWDQLDGALQEILAASLVAPSAEKRTRLSAALDVGSRAAASMRHAKPTDAELASVRRAAPDARIARSVESGIESEWNGRLGICASTLGIEPTTPLIRENATCSYREQVQYLLASESQTAFAAKVKDFCSSEKLDELYAHWIERLTPEEFSKLREDLRKRQQDELSETWGLELAARQERYANGLKEGWGVVLRPASLQELREKLVLRGRVVEEVRPQGSPVGLVRGDLVVDYGRLYDLVMGHSPVFGGLRPLAQVAASGGDLHVVRGNEMITVKVAGSGGAESP